MLLLESIVVPLQRASDAEMDPLQVAEHAEGRGGDDTVVAHNPQSIRADLAVAELHFPVRV